MVKVGSPAGLNARSASRRKLAGIYWSAATFVLVLLAAPVANGLRAAPMMTEMPAVSGVSTQATQDLNGDGMVDAVFTQKQRYNQVCFGNGTGAFTTCSNLVGAGDYQLSNQVNTTASALVDWDADGDLDIVLAMEGHSNVVCYNAGGDFNNGLGCVPLAGFDTFPYNSQDVAVGDLDGDGAPDLVFANGGNEGLPLNQPNLVCVGFNSQASSCHVFGTVDAPSTGVALGDIDGDTDLDVIVSNLDGLNEVCLNNGRSGNFFSFDCRAIPQAATVSATKDSNAVAVGHLPNGFAVAPDAYLDVVFGNTGKNERCFGNGNWAGTNVGLTCGGFNPVTSYTLSDAAARTTDVILADILPITVSPVYVGDEILLVNEDAPNVRCFGAFTCGFEFNPSQIVTVNIGGVDYVVSEPVIEATTGVAVRDINIDGKLDVVIANTGVTGGVSRMHPGAAFSPSVVAKSGLYPTSVTLSGGNVGPSAVDEDPPVMSGATDLTREATGPSGAAAHFAVTAVDVTDGPLPVTCVPASGSVFPLGDTTVTCTAEDEAGNVGTTSLVVTVVDTNGPAVLVPSDINVTAPAGQTTTAVSFVTSALDAVDGVREVFCFVGTSGVSSGDQFGGGTRTVTCGSYDSRKNYGESTFALTVRTDIDSDGLLDDVDLDDDGDGIADTVDVQPLVASSEYRFDATNTGPVARNGWTVSIAPTAPGSTYELRAALSGTGTAPAVIEARCGALRKELRLSAAGQTVDWRCIQNFPQANSLSVNFVSGAAEFWKATGGMWIRITPTAGGTGATAGSPVTADADNTAPLLVTLFDADQVEFGSFSLDAGESVAVDVVEIDGVPTLQLEVLNGGLDGTVAVTLFGQAVTLQQGSGPSTFGLGLTTCGAGSYLASPIDTSCTPAPPGTFVAVEGATQAVACAVGTYQPDAGQTACLLAPAGSFVAATGATASVPCAAGTYAASAGSASCTPAAPGFYVPASGSSSQTACAAGFGSDAGATECYPANNDADDDGVADIDDAFPNSNRAPLVSVGACHTTVANQLLPNGATFNDLIGHARLAAGGNHGAWVTRVVLLASVWKANGLISGRDFGAIVSCAARAKSDRDDHDGHHDWDDCRDGDHHRGGRDDRDDRDDKPGKGDKDKKDDRGGKSDKDHKSDKGKKK